MPQSELNRPAGINRRDLLGLGTGAVLISVLPLPAVAAEENMRAAQIALFGNRKINAGNGSICL